MGDLEMEGGCSKKLIKSKSGLRIVATNDEYSSPFLLCEPQWIPDSEVRVKMKLTVTMCRDVNFIMKAYTNHTYFNGTNVYLPEYKLRRV
jgi:hypothetical protein